MYYDYIDERTLGFIKTELFKVFIKTETEYKGKEYASKETPVEIYESMDIHSANEAIHEMATRIATNSISNVKELSQRQSDHKLTICLRNKDSSLTRSISKDIMIASVFTPNYQ